MSRNYSIYPGINTQVFIKVFVDIPTQILFDAFNVSLSKHTTSNNTCATIRTCALKHVKGATWSSTHEIPIGKKKNAGNYRFYLHQKKTVIFFIFLVTYKHFLSFFLINLYNSSSLPQSSVFSSSSSSSLLIITPLCTFTQ